MSLSPPVLSLHDVSFRYSPAAPDVLQRICLDIPEHAITAILGPNGSGKTTLLHLLLGLLSSTAGEIHLAGQPRDRYSRRELSRLVGLVPQSEHVPFDLSVLEYVLMGRAPYLSLLDLPKAADRRIALQALAMTGLTPLRGRPVPSLSGGERQLAMVARALAQKPQVLLLDEPTSHLDLGNKRRVLSLLQELQGGERTVILTSHDPNAAAAVADHVVLLREGRILAAGPTHQVLTEEHLSATYGVTVEVVQLRGRPLISVY
jgi:iron complex transport system ATP-binding protein